VRLDFTKEPLVALVRALFILAALLATSAVALGYHGLSEADVLHREPLFIAAAGFLLASAGWVVNNAVSLMLKVRDTSLEYMVKVTDRVNEAANLNLLWIKYDVDELVRDEAQLTRFFIVHSLDHPFFNAMRVMANSYEEVAVAVIKGAVDEDMLLRSFGTSFKWFYWSRLKPFIPLYRNDPPIPGNPRGSIPSPRTFSHCEELAERWLGREK
jgi:hypothetical protein